MPERGAWILVGLMASVVIARQELIPALDVQEKNLSDVAAWIEETASVNVLVDEALRDVKVTLHLQQPLTWQQTLKIVADVTDVELRWVTEETVRVFLPPRVKLALDRATVREAFRIISKAAGINVLVPEHLIEADRRVSLEFRNLHWREALDAIAESVGLRILERSEGKVFVLAQASANEEDAPLEGTDDPAWQDPASVSHEELVARLLALESEVRLLRERVAELEAEEEGR